VEGADIENITASRLKEKLDAGNGPELLDVREPWEFELARIEGSRLIPMWSWGNALASSTPAPKRW
jgi:rhodanese-related sulfurtransferase